MEFLFKYFLEVVFKNHKVFRKENQQQKSQNVGHILLPWGHVTGSCYLDLIKTAQSEREHGVCSANEAVSGTSKGNIVFGLGRKILKSDWSPIWPRCLESAKAFDRRIWLTPTVWWSFCLPTSCENPQMIDSRKQQPQKNSTLREETHLRKLILYRQTVTFTTN